MGKLDDYVKNVGLELAEGESSGYVQCPECQREGKFSVTRTSTGLLYHCFRDACPTAGHVGAVGIAYRKEKHKATNAPTLRPYTQQLRELHAYEYARFITKNGLTKAGIQSRGAFKYAPESNAYAFPVFGPMGYERGVVLRRYDGKGAKALTRMHSDGPLLSWHPPGAHRGDNRLVLVEDQVSAVKLSRYMPTVALLGTALSPEGAAEIASMKPKHVTIALDEDASNSAYRLRRFYGLMWPACDVVKLRKDVKDMSNKEIKELFCCAD